MENNLPENWKKILSDEFEKDYFTNLVQFVESERKSKNILPPKELVFSALEYASVSSIKVVIIGQDPYHGVGQANGLAFSVRKGIKFPPSLRNIFKELDSDLGIPTPDHGDLTKWANQGILLLNTTLTVREKSPASHAKKGWDIFTDKIISVISEAQSSVVFLLWGRFAQSKKRLIDDSKHIILDAAHPSPFSAHNGFFGCRHFSKVNEILKKNNESPIDWRLDNAQPVLF